MSTSIFAGLPTLSSYDPATTTEGSIDPLGLSLISESLGVALAPGIRERQSNPRFLTLLAVGNTLCQDFDGDAIAADGKSRPWQVFEWYVVEGLVRASQRGFVLENLPGVNKTSRVLRNGQHLNASRYLKTPGTFGFHGVYRTLAEYLDVEREGILGETGYRLVREWMDSSQLRGFHGSSGGPGHRIRAQLTDAIQEGMQKGEVVRTSTWEGWEYFPRYFSPQACGPKEAEIILEALTQPGEDFRRQLVQYLRSEEGAKAWSLTGRERDFHLAFLPKATPDLAFLIKAILDYEEFSRMAEDAFAACLHALTQTETRTTLSALSAHPMIIKAAKELPGLFESAYASLQKTGDILPLQESLRFQQRFSGLDGRLAPTEFAGALLDHHARIQKSKPPNGRLPWIERFPNGDAIIRPIYRRREWREREGEYVAGYRAAPISSFLGILAGGSPAA